MAFIFAYAKSGGGASGVVNDAPLDTEANYKNGVGTNGTTKGDLVIRNSGLIRRAKDGASPPAAVGVLEDVEFTGLVTSGPYAASRASFNAAITDSTLYPNGMGKIRPGGNNVFKVAVKSGQTAANANIGVAYGISQDAAGDQTVDLTNTANAQVTVEAISPDGKYVYVTLGA